MAAATAPASTSALSPFPGRTRWPLRPHLPVSPVSSSSPAITTSLCLRCSHSAGQPHHLTARKVGSPPAALAVKATATEAASGPSERWLLEPVDSALYQIRCQDCPKILSSIKDYSFVAFSSAVVAYTQNLLDFPSYTGDGDCRHIGFRVPMPGAFEMASDVVTVGRLPDKADMVIPVATVSGLHARLEKKEGALLVTDLDSTNGTFIDDKKLRPGAVATVSPGSCITFGDTHLAIFRVSKLQGEDLSEVPAGSEIKAETEVLQTKAAS